MGNKGILGGDGYIHYLDCGDGFTVSVKTYQIIIFKYVQLIVYQLFLDKAVGQDKVPSLTSFMF